MANQRLTSSASDHDLLIRLSENVISLGDSVDKLAVAQINTNRMIQDHAVQPGHAGVLALVHSQAQDLAELKGDLREQTATSAERIDKLNSIVSAHENRWKVIRMSGVVVAPVVAAVCAQIVRSKLGLSVG